MRITVLALMLLGSIHHRQYVDPAEHAFTDLVPDGWRVGGRMVRYGPLSLAPFLQAMTSDGTIFIQLGDWHIKDYADLPGWRPGTLYTPGTSILIIRRLETSEQYARSYASMFQKQLGCEHSAFGKSEAVPTPAVVAPLPQGRTETSVVPFTCTRSSQQYVGRVMATVQASRVPMSGISWSVVYLASFLARQDQADLALSVWNEMRETVQFQSEWSARQRMISAEAIKPAQHALDAALHQAQLFDEQIINGNITVNDPTTGTQSQIKMGVEPFYFSDNLGHFYGSYNPTPRLGFHPVQPAH
jgi:hypothetical protein